MLAKVPLQIYYSKWTS